MKSNELRIGNWVCLLEDKQIMWGKEIDGAELNYSPITLTKEWLLKFGLEIEPLNLGAYDVKLNDFFTLEFQLKDKWNEEDGFHLYVNGTEYDSNVFIKYVHEFQNLYYTLTKEELVLAVNPL